MRPQSDIRIDLKAALVDGPGTTRQLAQRTGWSIGLTMRTLDNMVRGGEAEKSDAPVRVPGVKRPVPVYRRPQCVDGPVPLRDLLAMWAMGQRSDVMSEHSMEAVM